MIAAIACVGLVTIFDAISPVEILAKLQPDVYVKGGDYRLDTIDQDERRIVESYNGKVEIVPVQPGLSSSMLMNRIRVAGHA